MLSSRLHARRAHNNLLWSSTTSTPIATEAMNRCVVSHRGVDCLVQVSHMSGERLDDGSIANRVVYCQISMAHLSGCLRQEAVAREVAPRGALAAHQKQR